MWGQFISAAARGARVPWAIAARRLGRGPRVVGEVRPAGRPLAAPISGRACVGYVAAIVHGGYQLVRESRGVPFVLEDKSGLLLVDPSDAELALGFESAGEEDLSGQVLSYREAIIGIGETIYVAGAEVRETRPDDPYRAAPRWLCAAPGRRLVIGRARGGSTRQVSSLVCAPASSVAMRAIRHCAG